MLMRTHTYTLRHMRSREGSSVFACMKLFVLMCKGGLVACMTSRDLAHVISRDLIIRFVCVISCDLV